MRLLNQLVKASLPHLVQLMVEWYSPLLEHLNLKKKTDFQLS